MFSVENLYYVLYNNLLRPNNIVDSFFTPFGSTAPDDLKFFTYHDFDNTGEMNHLRYCLFWDQEPIFQKQFDQVSVQHAGKILNRTHCKILANSEYSSLKNQICKDHNFLDFYYFYHGFAALDWLRDYKYLNKTNNFDKVFITLNRLCTQERSYRLTLVSHLLEENLVDKGHVSLHYLSKPNLSLKEELFDADSLLSKNSKKLIYKNLFNRNKEFLLDGAVGGAASAHVGHQEHNLLTSAFLNVVTETVFYHNKLHLTEKIFKPIATYRPFLLVASPGSLSYLKSYGFKTFDRWIDESYDLEQDHDTRIEKIVKEISKIGQLSKTQLVDMYYDMIPILEHNHEHFYNNFKISITKELLTNWQNVFHRWNNGLGSRDQLKLENYDFDKLLKLIAQ